MKRLLGALLRFVSRISIRLLAFNVLLVFLPLAGIWSLERYERHLLDMQERSSVQQGRILAAALGEAGPLGEEDARRVLQNLRQRQDARLRIIDSDYRLLADSSLLGPRLVQVQDVADVPSEVAGGGARPVDDGEPRDTLLYRFGSTLYRTYERGFKPPAMPILDYEYYATAKRFDGVEIDEALAGRYGQATRLSTDGRSLTLYSAIPIRSREHVVGVALVSKSTFTILTMLYDLRLQMFRVILMSAAAAAVLSLLVSTTIARPIRKLRTEAKRMLDRRGRLRGRFAESRRLDEIGDLTRALHELTRRLEGHLQFIESFASDVSHEFKNPLASIRNAADLLAEVEDPEERKRFHSMLLHDLARLGNLLSGVREISQIDARIEETPVKEVALDDLLRVLVEQFELREARRDDAVRFSLETSTTAVRVEAVPDRLAQVFENLLDNARSFSPKDGEVSVVLAVKGRRATVTIADQGPGIPEEHREKMFSRFFSYRPDGGAKKDGHTGLGLAIVRAIVEATGGTATAANGENGGAVLTVALPLA